MSNRKQIWLEEDEVVVKREYLVNAQEILAAFLRGTVLVNDDGLDAELDSAVKQMVEVVKKIQKERENHFDYLDIDGADETDKYLTQLLGRKWEPIEGSKTN